MAALLLLLLGVVFWFYLAFFSNQLLQNSSEKLALTAAQKLNDNDDVGRLNSLSANSRELVYSARQMHELTESQRNFAEFEPLAAQVLSESREGAMKLAGERNRCASNTVREIKEILKAQTSPFAREVALFDAAADKPEIVDVSVGTTENLESNVAVSSGLPELLAYDQSQGFVRKGKEADFYCANTSLRLPEPDQDLDFTMAPLAMSVKGTTSPLRLVSKDHFVSATSLWKDGKDTNNKCSVSPSSVQVTMKVRMKSKVAKGLESGTISRSTACGTGANPEPDR